MTGHDRPKTQWISKEHRQSPCSQKEGGEETDIYRYIDDYNRNHAYALHLSHVRLCETL